jgi:hypothetical protein
MVFERGCKAKKKNGKMQLCKPERANKDTGSNCLKEQYSTSNLVAAGLGSGKRDKEGAWS